MRGDGFGSGYSSLPDRHGFQRIKYEPRKYSACEKSPFQIHIQKPPEACREHPAIFNNERGKALFPCVEPAFQITTTGTLVIKEYPNRHLSIHPQEIGKDLLRQITDCCILKVTNRTFRYQ